MSDLGWIVVPNWNGPDGFQHYKDRDPKWIKNYGRLLAKDDYLGLSLHRRGILHGLWLAYAASDGRLRGDTASLSRRLHGKVSTADLEALNHAGFISFSASRPLALRYQNASLEVEKERETLAKGRSSALTSQSTEEIETLVNPIELVGVTPLRRKVDPRQRSGDKTSTYTGCRQTRGHGGFGYVHDTLGIDLPPADWPHKPPTAAEVARALEARRKIVHRDPDDDSGYVVPKGWEA